MILVGNSQNQKLHNLSYLTLITVSNKCQLFDHELISKAKKWSIPISYYHGEIDFPVLENRVNEYESLVNRAYELGISFDTSNYSPIYLSCMIEEEEILQILETKNQYRSYC
ncbi:MAG: hypothetical protein EOP33_01070 [Rickettsiaceae bacterium]|nr:MAG: hypothetical protein EOP33_01070 [Rickettsiaceae bacterium]